MLRNNKNGKKAGFSPVEELKIFHWEKVLKNKLGKIEQYSKISFPISKFWKKCPYKNRLQIETFNFKSIWNLIETES